METASKNRLAKPAQRVKSARFSPSSPLNRDHQANISSILRSTGAQAKLTIGQPNDKYEQEADRVADQVMRMSDADVAQRVETGTVQPMRIQRMCPECEEGLAQHQPADEEEQIQAKEMAGQTPEVTPGLESRINSLKSGGQPLDPATRSFFEPRFGHSFSGVRVHQGGRATDVSRSINARAFTMGNHVVMGSGEYQPQSGEGKRLLGHELTHVVQQSANTIARTNIQRTTGDGHDLQSSRFAGDVSLEAAFDGKKYIKNGSRGEDVKKIQEALISLGYGLPKFGPDGIFGGETSSAVKNYQGSKAFQVDGIVGPETMGGLDRSFIVGSGGGVTPVTPTPVVPNTITSETVAISPSVRTRTDIGVGEEVRLTYSAGVAFWLTTGGTLSSSSGSSVTLTAPDKARKVTVRAGTGVGGVATKDFTVIAPTGVHMDRLGATGVKHTFNQADVGIATQPFLLPDTVNFHKVVYHELDTNATNTTPFLCRLPLGHCGAGGGGVPCPDLNLTNIVENGKGTKAVSGDCAYMGSCGTTPPYVPVTVTAQIPYEYKVGSGRFFNIRTVTQVHELESDASTLTTSKAGANGKTTVAAATVSIPGC